MTALPSIANIAAWFDSTTGLSSSAWVDRSGNGNDLPAVGEPNIVDAVINGHKVLRTVDGENDNIFQGPITEIQGPLSFFVLFKLRNALSGSMYAAELDHQTLKNYIEVYGFGGGSFSADVGDNSDGYASGEISSAPPVGEWLFCLVTVTDPESVPRFFIAGEEISSKAEYESLPFASLTYDTISVGASGLGGATTKDLDIAAVGLIGSALSDADRNALYAWMNDVYGLDLPADAETSVGAEVLTGVSDLLVRIGNGNVAYLTPALREYLESIDDAELLADVAEVLHRAETEVQLIMYVPPALKAHLEALT